MAAAAASENDASPPIASGRERRRGRETDDVEASSDEPDEADVNDAVVVTWAADSMEKEGAGVVVFRTTVSSASDAWSDSSASCPADKEEEKEEEGVEEDPAVEACSDAVAQSVAAPAGPQSDSDEWSVAESDESDDEVDDDVDAPSVASPCEAREEAAAATDRESPAGAVAMESRGPNSFLHTADCNEDEPSNRGLPHAGAGPAPAAPAAPAAPVADARLCRLAPSVLEAEGRAVGELN